MHETQRLRANIWKLYALKMLRSFMLMMPIMTLFLQENGLSLFQIFVSQAVFSAVAIVFEIPSGYFADRYGMRLSLIIGAISAWLGVSLYALSYDFVSVLVAEVLLGTSLAFISGADSALLYETEHALGERDAYTQKEARMFAWSSFSEGIASILGGFLALASLRVPVLVQAVVLVGMIPIAISLYEPAYMRVHKTILASGTALSTMWRTFVHTMHTHATLKWLVIYAAFIDALTLVSVWFRQPYFEQATLPLAYFGIVWALFMFISSLAALVAQRCERIFGVLGTLTLISILGVGAYLVLGLSTSIALIVVFAVFSIVRGIKEPLIREYIQTRADPAVRATTLSIKGFVGRVVFMVLGPFFGWYADVYALSQALMLCGFVFGALMIVALVMLARHLKTTL